MKTPFAKHFLALALAEDISSRNPALTTEEVSSVVSSMLTDNELTGLIGDFITRRMNESSNPTGETVENSPITSTTSCKDVEQEVLDQLKVWRA